MYLLLAIIPAVFGLWISPGNISDVPFSKLTLRRLFASLFEIASYGVALYFGGKSLDIDRIWPWRWTLPYLGNLIVRSGFSALIIYGSIIVIEDKNLDGWLLAAC